MENQTCFDLERAVEDWRHELAAQTGLTPEVRRELETHLSDSIAGFQRQGLNNEESFWLARRRIGPPQQFVEEFAKADPAKVWRERVFWLAFGLLIFRLWTVLISSFFIPLYMRLITPGYVQKHLENLLPQWASFYLPHWLRELNYIHYLFFFLEVINGLFMVVAIMFLVRGKLEKARPVLEFASQNRLRFFLATSLLVLFVLVISNLLWFTFSDSWRENYVTHFFNNGFELVLFVALATWLLPAQVQRSPRRV